MLEFLTRLLGIKRPAYIYYVVDWAGNGTAAIATLTEAKIAKRDLGNGARIMRKPLSS